MVRRLALVAVLTIGLSLSWGCGGGGGGSSSSPSPKDAWLGDWKTDGTSQMDQILGSTTQAHVTKEAEHYVAVLTSTTDNTTGTAWVLRPTSAAGDVLISESKSTTASSGHTLTTSLKWTIDADGTGFSSATVIITEAGEQSFDFHYVRAHTSSSPPP